MDKIILGILFVLLLVGFQWFYHHACAFGEYLLDGKGTSFAFFGVGFGTILGILAVAVLFFWIVGSVADNILRFIFNT